MSSRSTNEAMPRRAGPVTPASSARRIASRKGDPLDAGELVEPRHAGVADAALGHVEHALDVDLVGRVDERSQVRHRVLDLTPVVEARAADHLVRHAHAHERLFDHAALGVGAVEHGDLAPVHAVVAVQLLRRAGHPDRLVALVLGVVADDAVAHAGVGPQRLRLAFDVVLDHRVGSVEDRLRRPVVLIEHDRRDVRKRILELKNVPEVSPAKFVHTVVHQHAVGEVRVHPLDLQVVHRPVVCDTIDQLDLGRGEFVVRADQQLDPDRQLTCGNEIESSPANQQRPLQFKAGTGSEPLADCEGLVIPLGSCARVDRPRTAPRAATLSRRRTS